MRSLALVRFVHLAAVCSLSLAAPGLKPQLLDVQSEMFIPHVEKVLSIKTIDGKKLLLECKEDDTTPPPDRETPQNATQSPECVQAYKLRDAILDAAKEKKEQCENPKGGCRGWGDCLPMGCECSSYNPYGYYCAKDTTCHTKGHAMAAMVSTFTNPGGGFYSGATTYLIDVAANAVGETSYCIPNDPFSLKSDIMAFASISTTLVAGAWFGPKALSGLWQEEAQAMASAMRNRVGGSHGRFALSETSRQLSAVTFL